MSKNSHLLDKWIYATIVDNPDIVKTAKSAIELYSDINRIFVEDMQEFMKEMAKEILKVEKN